MERSKNDVGLIEPNLRNLQDSDLLDDFLNNNGLLRFAPLMQENQVTWDDLMYLRNNPNELMILLPNFRDRLDFAKALKTARGVDKQTQCDLDPPFKGKETLVEICTRYDTGKMFLELYKTVNGKKNYSAKSRTYLKKALVEHYFRRGRGQITHQNFEEMLELIVDELPEESPTIWYFSDGGKQGGFLYTRYRYVQQHDKRFRKPKETVVTSAKDEVEKSWNQLTEHQQNACHAAKIKLMDISYTNYDAVTLLWDASYQLRRYEATSGNLKFEEWQIIEKYDNVAGLVTSDFIKINLPENDKFLARIPHFINSYRLIFEDYVEYIKEDEALKQSMVASFATGRLSEAVLFYAFYSLPLILKQCFTHATGEKRMKVSLCENRTTFISLVQSEAKILETVQARQKAARERKSTVLPFIIAVGELNCIEAYFVCMDHILYKMDNVSAAVDLLFKIHSVFHLRYAQECENVFKFLQEYFYNLSYPGDRKDPTVAAFITDLNRS